MPFANQILGGQNKLIRPSIQSPNYSPGPTPAGWTINKDGSAEFADLTVYGVIVAEGTEIAFPGGGYISESGTPYLTFGGDPLDILTPIWSVLDAVEPGTTATPESWHSLGSAGSTGCTLEQARYRITVENELWIDIALVAGSGGSTAGTYTWSNTLPSGYQFPGNFLRVYPLAYNAAITGGAQAAIIAIDGNGTASPGRVRMTLPALAANVNITGTPRIPLN